MHNSLSHDQDPSVSAGEGSVQLQKILYSAPFRNAPGLQKFLEYVVNKTLAGFSSEIKEYSIAVEVLGKPSDYDPHHDTTVRVQAHRLREKIEEYYATEGSNDEILIELPKGHYIPEFCRRSAAASREETHESFSSSPADDQPGNLPVSAWPVTASAPERASRGTGLSWPTAIIGAAILFVAGVFLAPAIRRIALLPARSPKPALAAGVTAKPLDTVWAAFWRDPAPAVAAYSNSMFLVTETSDLLRLKAADLDGLGAPASGSEALKLAENPGLAEKAGPVFFNDGYTGTGEVMAVYDLERLFSGSHRALTVERSQLLTATDFKNHNVIFLGSVIENPILSGLPLTQSFVFAQPKRPPILWRSRILNLHPAPGEKSFYQVERDPKTQVLEADYALVSFLPGVAPGREIVVLGGLTTLGTEAAAQFVTSPRGAQEIIERLGQQDPHASDSRLPRYFQALLKVDIQKEQILKVQYITGRPIRSAGQGL
jgi:hypothetical protein